MNTHFTYERYGRQTLLTGFGKDGQRKLLTASVAVIGAGGLGCPALLYLAASGIGKIGIVDDDAVALHNLHRQVLYTTEDLGLPKAETAAKRLQKLNPEIQITAHNLRLTEKNAFDLLSAYDVVLDGTDNFASRYLINDACVLLNKPLVYGAVSQFEGQVAVFNAGPQPAVNYRDLFPQPPPPGSVLNCAEAGVLGVLPGIIGTLQATEVIKWFTGMGKPLANQFLTYNALTNESFVYALNKNKEAAAFLPKDRLAFEARNYGWECERPTGVEEIDAVTFSTLLQQEDVTVIDVREHGELPEVSEFNHQKIPLSALEATRLGDVEKTVVVFCQSGKRSLQAARLLSATFDAGKTVYSLRGGILHWKQEHGKKA